MSKTETSINIVKIEKDSADGVLVTFSDGTVAGYIVEELLMLRPIRESVEAYRDRVDPPRFSTLTSMSARC